MNDMNIAICFGEVLWDILTDGPVPGGAPLNVAYHLNKMGISTGLVSRIGRDDNGYKLLGKISDWGIKETLLQFDDFYPTSQVIATMNGNEVSYDIVYPVAWDFIDINSKLAISIANSSYVIYGTLAARNDTSRDTLFDLLNCNAKKVFDINLRPPFISKDLIEKLLHKADIVKFNQSELELVQLMFGGAFHGEASQVKFIQDYFHIPEVLVTKGEYGASYYKNFEVYHARGGQIPVSDTIGSGDSFLAAFVANHYLNENPENILKNAVAMGAFIAMRRGGCPEYKLSEYNNFKKNLKTI